jgi:hypothetical protein
MNLKLFFMKVKYLVLALMVAISSFAYAQDNKEKKEKKGPTPEQMIEFHVGKVEKQLMLDDATSAKFVTLYKEYLVEMAKCRPEIVRGKDLTDAQIKKNIESRMNAEQKALDVKKKYYKSLSKILNAKQLQKIFSDRNEGVRPGKNAFAPRGGNAKKGNAGFPGKKGFAPHKMGGGKGQCKSVCK